ncbi:hypothetical protein HJC99_06365 [Candidatus Saccharibacteria bacterium]|nr:hypothetical protein [Candidatus Saccharibacteria bacterium]
MTDSNASEMAAPADAGANLGRRGRDFQLDRWSNRAALSDGPYSPIGSAAIDSSLMSHRLVVVGRLIDALNVAEGPDPTRESDAMSLLPYAFRPAKAQ